MTKWLILLFLSGCAQVTSLNLQKHQFGRIPTKIIWIQVAGLSSEHLAMLKFSYPSRDQNTAFENSLCTGSAWEYNLFDIRPPASSGFMSQITGKKNIKNTCEDFDRKPVWKYIAPKGYKVGVFEGQALKDQSLLKVSSCSEKNDFLKETTYWGMHKPPANSETFHVNTERDFKTGEIYYDKSCSSGDCFTSFSRNVERAFAQFNKNSNNYLYLVRNFRYQNLLKNKNFQKAAEELVQINEVLNYFQNFAKKRSDTLVLLTTAETIELDFPKVGKEWDDYLKKGNFIKTKNTKLISAVYSYGARAENFCGIYDQSQILSRIFSGAKQQGLEFSIINPFD